MLDYDAWKVAPWLPPGSCGDAHISRVEVSHDASEWDRVRSIVNGGGRYCRPGTYTQLFVAGELVMSDTVDEVRDHLEPVYAADTMQASTVLVNGLGLGMVTAQLCDLPSVRHVDVVEASGDVIALVERHLRERVAESGATLEIHHADALDVRWPVGARWDVVWSDIWSGIGADNHETMKRLRRRYGQRSQWHRCWCEAQVARLVEQDKRDVAWWRG